MKKDGSEFPSPVLGNNIEIGCNASIIGDIKIGNNVTIGVGSVVLEDIPDNSISIGNPAFYKEKK
jgi:putative colanic acid biosynthesis acetyltransferase WcaB